MDDRDADRDEHRGEARAERQDEEQPEADPVEADRREQDDQRARARHDPSREAQREELAGGDRAVGVVVPVPVGVVMRVVVAVVVIGAVRVVVPVRVVVAVVRMAVVRVGVVVRVVVHVTAGMATVVVCAMLVRVRLVAMVVAGRARAQAVPQEPAAQPGDQQPRREPHPRVETLGHHVARCVQRDRTQRVDAEGVGRRHDQPEPRGVRRGAAAPHEVCGHHGLAVPGLERVEGAERRGDGQREERARHAHRLEREHVRQPAA